MILQAVTAAPCSARNAARLRVDTEQLLFPLKYTFLPHSTHHVPFFVVIHYIIFHWNEIAFSLSCCSFYLLLLLNFQTHYVRFFVFLLAFSFWYSLVRSLGAPPVLSCYVISTSESVLQLAEYGFSSTTLTL
jgi:hypothetical protein